MRKYIPVVVNAYRSWREYKKDENWIDRTHTNAAASNLQNVADGFNQKIEESTRIDPRPSSFFDFANVINHGRFSDRIVDDFKSLRNAIMIIFLLFPYRILFYEVKQIPYQSHFHFFVISPRNFSFLKMKLCIYHMTM